MTGMRAAARHGWSARRQPPTAQVAGVGGDDGQVVGVQIGGEEIGQRDQVDGEAVAFEQRLEVYGSIGALLEDVDDASAVTLRDSAAHVRADSASKPSDPASLAVTSCLAILGGQPEEEGGLSGADGRREGEGEIAAGLLDAGRRHDCRARLW